MVKVSDREITTKEQSTGKTVLIPYGMVVWSTGIGTRPVVTDFMKQIGQVFNPDSHPVEFNQLASLIHNIINLSVSL